MEEALLLLYLSDGSVSVGILQGAGFGLHPFCVLHTLMEREVDFYERE